MHTLNHIEFLVNEDVPRRLRRNGFLSESLVRYEMSTSGPSVEKLHRELLSSLRKSTDEKTMYAVIKTCQFSIIPLIDTLYDWLSDEEEKQLNINNPQDREAILYRHLYQVLYDWHSAIQMELYDYIDPHYIIPAPDRRTLKESCTKCLKQLTRSPRFRSLDRALQAVVIEPLELSRSVFTPDYFTHVWKKYLRILIDQLNVFMKDDEDSEECLHTVLQVINFNGKHYIAYLTNQFSIVSGAITDNKDRYRWLIERRKATAQTVFNEGLSLEPSHRTLREQLDDWFKWEIYYVKKLMQMETTA